MKEDTGDNPDKPWAPKREDVMSVREHQVKRKFTLVLDLSDLAVILVSMLIGAVLSVLINRATSIANVIGADCNPDQISILRFDGAIERVCLPAGMTAMEGEKKIKRKK